MSVTYDIFWIKAQVKFFSQEILSKNEEMTSILNMTKFSRLDRNNAMQKIRQLSIIVNTKLNI